MREIDLHGLKVSEALSAFVEVHNSIVASGKREGVKVIHGYGSSGAGGEIRVAIRTLLRNNPACADWVRGEDAEGNPGYTIVYPRRRLPPGGERLWDAIVEFCSSPRTQQDVVCRFVRKSSEPEVNRALRELEQRGRLRVLYKNGRKHYVDSRV